MRDLQEFPLAFVWPRAQKMVVLRDFKGLDNF